MGEAMRAALTMPQEEQRERMRRMREIVRDNNIYRWAGSMLQDARSLAQAQRDPGGDDASRRPNHTSPTMS